MQLSSEECEEEKNLILQDLYCILAAPLIGNWFMIIKCRMPLEAVEALSLKRIRTPLLFKNR